MRGGPRPEAAAAAAAGGVGYAARCHSRCVCVYRCMYVMIACSWSAVKADARRWQQQLVEHLLQPSCVEGLRMTLGFPNGESQGKTKCLSDQ